MELRQIRSFRVVAAEEHFRRAAEKLNIAQPALSLQVRQLEEELGTQLFERVGRGVRLTDAGSLFWDYADRIVSLVDESAEATREHSALVRGRLRIGIAQTPNCCFGPLVISAFKRRYPQVFVSLAELAADEIETSLLKGELDLGIGFGPCDSPNLASETLYEERFVALAPRGHPWYNKKTISLKTLAQAELILLTRDYCTRRIFEKTCDDLDVSLKVAIEMNTIEGIIASLESTGLASVLPAQVANSPLMNATLRSVPIAQPGIRRKVALVYRKSGYLSPAAHAMATEWKTLAKSL
ncbi:LysR substrate-binding domain-containing protein [Pelagicoccus sp. SDUM812002]|uniref:LysR substrate-binding domain-containing protein n=1 Tax=Pelagicoccus sp. SDUM812002 TaxID=3041266 RepID=UPI00280DF9A1|nr:LysR substrate-binding domain-containing protein [Pelagicoccus sp. SDUM812002]MDQ8186316.1 LysR substrate-binding domain-containing protein [Pelagicoccus sp. SDUM812002]